MTAAAARRPLYSRAVPAALRSAAGAALLLLLPSASLRAQSSLPGFAAEVSTVAVSTSPYQGIPLSQDKGPWVVGEVRFTGHSTLSDYALQNRVRGRRGVLYTPSDIAGDLKELQSMPGVLSARCDLFAIPGLGAPENYAAIVVSTMMVRLVYTLEEKTLFLPGMSSTAAASGRTTESPRDMTPPAAVSGIVLTPTAYRGLGHNNRPGLGLDINTAYYIGRLYGKNNLSYTTKKSNFIDRLGVWLFTFDGKMQLQSEGDFKPALASGVQGTFTFRDAPQPSLQTVNVTVKPTEKTNTTMAGAYFVATKKIYGVRSSLGFMQGNAGDSVAQLSEYLTEQALLFGGNPGQKAASKSTLFASLLVLPTPSYPLAVEMVKPNGMALNPILFNFKLGHFLKLNFDLAYLKFAGGWDLMGMFQFRYNQFPKK